MNPRHNYTLHLDADSDLAVDAEASSQLTGGVVFLGPIAIYADDMAALADILERASKMARSVAADQQYEQGGVES